MTRFRVMQIIEATDGGTGRHVSQAVEALAAAGFELHVVCSTRRSPRFYNAIAAIRADGHRVTVLPLTRAPHLLLDPFCLVRIRALIREWPCEVIYLHSSKAGFLGRMAAMGLRGKVVYAPHAPYFLRAKGPLALPGLFRCLERLGARRVDILHAVSDAEAATMVENHIYGSERVFVLENALDVAGFRRQTEPLRAIAPAGQPRCFGFIGALRQQKAPLLFLQAVRLAAERDIDASFVLPSRGRQLAASRHYVARYGLDRYVRFVEAEQSLREVYRRMDVAVLPSLWEGLPYTLLEAMALARPVITSDIPVFRQIVGSVDPQLTFPADDAEALAARLIDWAARPASEIEAAGERLRDRVLEKHDAGQWRRRLVAFVGTLAADQLERQRQRSDMKTPAV